MKAINWIGENIVFTTKATQKISSIVLITHEMSMTALKIIEKVTLNRSVEILGIRYYFL